jgi:hypothetical protein
LVFSVTVNKYSNVISQHGLADRGHARSNFVPVKQVRMARGIHALPKVSPGPAMPYPSTPCGQATRKTGGCPLDTPRRTGLPSNSSRRATASSSNGCCLRPYSSWAQWAEIWRKRDQTGITFMGLCHGNHFVPCGRPSMVWLNGRPVRGPVQGWQLFIKLHQIVLNEFYIIPKFPSSGPLW